MHDELCELTFETAVGKFKNGKGLLNPYTITDAAAVKDAAS